MYIYTLHVLQATHVAVEDDDVLPVSSQPGVKVPAQVHQLLHVRHPSVWPCKVCNLHTQEDCELHGSNCMHNLDLRDSLKTMQHNTIYIL